MTNSLRVLIADDYIRSRSGLRVLLATWPGIEVIAEATNGEEAICRVAETQPDVVLMDARMPVMNGLEATRRIKSRWPKVKIVVLTMHAGHRSDALAAGADAFLVKGRSPEELLHTLINSNNSELPQVAA